MPALKSAPTDPTGPGQIRCRVWKHPELNSHSLLVLTRDRLHLAPLGGSPKPEVVAAAEAGADLDKLLGPLATVVNLPAVRRLRLDLLSNALIVEYAAGLGLARLTITFATPKAADACFTKVWRRLGERYQLEPYRRDFWGVARTPLILLGAVLAATAIVALSVNLFDDLAAARSAATVSVPVAGEAGTALELPRSPFGGLNWRVVCGVGGAIAAGLQVWLYRRLTQPPVVLELTRT